MVIEPTCASAPRWPQSYMLKNIYEILTIGRSTHTIINIFFFQLHAVSRMYQQVGRSLVIRHSASLFPPNSGSIACWMAELNAAYFILLFTYILCPHKKKLLQQGSLCYVRLRGQSLSKTCSRHTQVWRGDGIDEIWHVHLPYAI